MRKEEQSEVLCYSASQTSSQMRAHVLRHSGGQLLRNRGPVQLFSTGEY